VSDYRDAVNKLIGWAAFFHGAQTLADLADVSMRTLMRESGISDLADAIPVDQAADEVVSELEVGSAFETFFRALDGRRQMIALRRAYSENPEVLEQLGVELGVTRERARQLEADLKKLFRAHAGTRFMQSAIRLRRTLPMVVSPARLGLILRRLVDQASPELQNAARLALSEYIGYEKSGEMWVSREFRELVGPVRERIPDFSDQYGILDEQGLRTFFGIDMGETWDVLTQAAGLKRVQEHLLIRDTREARLVLALRRLGEPASKEQLAESTGLEIRSLSAVLSNSDSFVRVTKDTWGLVGSTDDPYDGVVGEIIQRIESGGGEANVHELLIEIPERFGVSPGTVNAYLATPKFSLDGDVVRCAEVPGVETPPLSELREVVWTDDGCPVLRLRIADQHLGGWSIKIPPAVAMQLGVGPDSDSIVPVRLPDGCQSASVIWRAHDPNGPEIGRLREALLALKASAGTEVFIVLDPYGLVVTADDSGFHARHQATSDEVSPRSNENLATSSSPALERIKSRRRF
jgi:hypothetical protein